MFLVELIASSFLDLISKQARRNAAVSALLLLGCPACPVINSVFGRLWRQTAFQGREDTRVWYRETMFSQMVPYDFSLHGALHGYFLYLVSAPPGKPRRRCEPDEGYLRCSKGFDQKESLYKFCHCSSLSQLMMLALGNSEKCLRCIQTHTPFTVGSH